MAWTWFLLLALPFFSQLHGFPAVSEEEDDAVLGFAKRQQVELRRIAADVPLMNFRQSLRKTNPDWMGSLPEHVKQMPLTGIAIPGSHDSFTSELDPSQELGPSPDLSPTLKKVVNFFGRAAKQIIYNWGVTQGHTIREQLEAGIRYLDFRIAARASKNREIYLLHSLFAQTAKKAMLDVKAFLDQHPTEVVIIDINHFYDMNSADHQNFVRDVMEIFGSKLASTRGELTLNNLWKEKQQVILIYQHYVQDRDERLWSNQHITSPWPNKNKKKEAIDYLNMLSGAHDDLEYFWVTQGILTPDAKDIIWGVASSLKTRLALGMTKEISNNWLKGKKIGKGGVNIVITDFVSEANFIDNVIALNYSN